MKKTALITGASLGIGRELARIFAENGCDLVLVARSKSNLENLAKELRTKSGAKVTILSKDLSDFKSPTDIYKDLQKQKIEIDYLVNNAGFGNLGPLAETDLQRELDLIQVNITSLAHLTKLFVRDFVKRKSGKILNVGSTAGFQAGPFMANYYASKAYVILLTEALAVELKGTGVTASVLCPGATATEFAKTAGNDKTTLFSNPLSRFTVMPADRVAELGYKGMMAGKTVIIAGFHNQAMTFSARFSPRKLVTLIAGKMNQT